MTHSKLHQKRQELAEAHRNYRLTLLKSVGAPCGALIGCYFACIRAGLEQTQAIQITGAVMVVGLVLAALLIWYAFK